MEHTQPTADSERLESFVQRATNDHGKDALFTYEKRDPDNQEIKKPYTLVLGQAVRICGIHMMEADDDELDDTLDYMRNKAKKYEDAIEAGDLEAKAKFEQSIIDGNAVFSRMVPVEQG